MTIIVTPRPYSEMVRTLREFEGWRSLWWRLPTAGLLFAAVPLFFIGATVLAAFIAGDDFNLTTAIVAAIVGVGATGILGPRLARRQLHRRVIADHLWSFEKLNPPTEVQVLLREPDLEAARRALRRAKFNPGVYTVRLGSPPQDALDLDRKLAVHEPEAWTQSASDQDRTRRIAAALREAGIRARVAASDVLPAPNRATGSTDHEPEEGRATDMLPPTSLPENDETP